MQTFVMDGNFSAEHLKMRKPLDDVPLADGHGFMVTDASYKQHLSEATEDREVSGALAFLQFRVLMGSATDNRALRYQQSTCNAHRAVNKANADRHDMEATGIGAVACGRHGCFIPHTVVDFQKGER